MASLFLTTLGHAFGVYDEGSHDFSSYLIQEAPSLCTYHDDVQI